MSAPRHLPSVAMIAAFTALVGCGGTPNTPATPAEGMSGPNVSPRAATTATAQSTAPGTAAIASSLDGSTLPTDGATDSSSVATASAVFGGDPTTSASPPPPAALTYTLQKGSDCTFLWFGCKETATVTVANPNPVGKNAYLQVTFTAKGTAVETQPLGMPQILYVPAGGTTVATYSATVKSDDVKVSLTDHLF